MSKKLATGEKENMEYTHAWISLCRLCGTNYKLPITRTGKSVALVVVSQPQTSGKTFRIDAAKFDAGITQVRGSWAIKPWNAEAEEIMAREKNWQT